MYILINIPKITHCRPIPDRALSTGWRSTLPRLQPSTSPGIGRRVDWYSYTNVSAERDPHFSCDVGISRFLRNNAIYIPACLASHLRIRYSLYITAQSWILHPYYESITKWLRKFWRIIEGLTGVDAALWVMTSFSPVCVSQRLFKSVATLFTVKIKHFPKYGRQFFELL